MGVSAAKATQEGTLLFGRHDNWRVLCSNWRLWRLPCWWHIWRLWRLWRLWRHLNWCHICSSHFLCSSNVDDAVDGSSNVDDADGSSCEHANGNSSSVDDADGSSNADDADGSSNADDADGSANCTIYDRYAFYVTLWCITLWKATC